jgi:hypothetical protein
VIFFTTPEHHPKLKGRSSTTLWNAASFCASLERWRGTMEPDALYKAVRQILMREWDPIGVSDVQAAQDEYDKYIRPIVRLVLKNASPSVLSEHLLHIENVEMGLRADRRRALRAAEKLRALHP